MTVHLGYSSLPHELELAIDQARIVDAASSFVTGFTQGPSGSNAERMT
jgi:hypothetical protein